MANAIGQSLYFVAFNGSLTSQEEKRSQYAKIQAHLARVGQHKRKKAKQDRLQPSYSLGEIPKRFLTQSGTAEHHGSTCLKGRRMHNQSIIPNQVESDTEKENEELNNARNRQASTHHEHSQSQEMCRRNTNNQFPELMFMRRASSVPFYSCFCNSFAGLDPVTVLEGIEFYWKVTVPSHITLANLLQYQTRWGTCVMSVIRDPLYWYCSTSLRAVQQSTINDSEVQATPQVLRLIGLTLEGLRDRPQQSSEFPDHMSVLIVVYLIEISYRLRDYLACQVHRQYLRLMVKQLGGAELIGQMGLVGDAIVDYDSHWFFEAGEFVFPELHPELELHYIDTLTPDDGQQLLAMLPAGFYELVRTSRLSIELGRNIARMIQISNNPLALSNASLDNEVPLKEDMFGACPGLHKIKDTTSPLDLEAATSTALVLYHCRTITSHRTVFGKLNAIRTRLTRGLQTPGFGSSQAERNCWIWIWVITIESWQTMCGVLNQEGERLLSQLVSENQTITDKLDWHGIEAIFKKFLWTPSLNRSFKSRWDRAEHRYHLRSPRQSANIPGLAD